MVADPRRWVAFGLPMVARFVFTMYCHCSFVEARQSQQMEATELKIASMQLTSHPKLSNLHRHSTAPMHINAQKLLYAQQELTTQSAALESRFLATSK